MPFNRMISNWIEQLVALANLARPVLRTIPAQAAGTALEEVVYVAPTSTTGPGYGAGATLSRAGFYPNAAIAAVATNLQTLTFRQYRANGTFVGTVGSAYATSTAATALIETNMLANGAVALQPGDIITLKSVTSGTGAALPTMTSVVEVSASVSGAAAL